MESKGKVLVVDDSPANIQIINNILKNEYEVYCATCGEDAIKIALSVVPDVILLDVLMPGVSGYDVLKILKEDVTTKEIPIIFITALDDMENEIKGLEAGAVDYITKPVISAVLKARVKTHLELKKQRDFLKNLATIDGLTGLANRRLLDEYIEKYFKLCERKFLPMSVIMVDIDHFKLYNDHYGHIMGDECLKKIALSIKNSLKRGYDLAARYGGEEFCVVLPETGLKQALKVAERIKTNLEHEKIEHVTSPIAAYVTISMGIASGIPNKKITWEDFLAKADEALYLAKTGGRNTISCIEIN